MPESSNRRAIPSVDKVLKNLGRTGLPRPVVVAVVRRQLETLRSCAQVPELSEVMAHIRSVLEHWRSSRIQPVINGTGILVHTNLGRAPLGEEVVEAVSRIAANYHNLEYDLSRGERGGRAAYLEHNLALLCGAEAATVVNNGAAALLLILRHLTARKPEVVISRGELIQIGGGFRIPEILSAGGARLVEVGTTNQTSLEDYSHAIGDQTALILKVHRSNFFMEGFVGSPSIEAMAGLARQHRLPLVEDLGSGAVVSTEKLGPVDHEPTPAESLRQGVDLVCFSGDKLLGGPQAGLIAGEAARVAALKKDPLFRALRCDKLILTALQSTVDSYLEHQGADLPSSRDLWRIPVIAMLEVNTDDLRMRAQKIREALRDVPVECRIGDGQARIGGGTLPRSSIPSITLDLLPARIPLPELAARLRRTSPPVVGYVSQSVFKLDLRTIFPRQDAELIQALRSVLDVNPSPGSNSNSPDAEWGE